MHLATFIQPHCTSRQADKFTNTHTQTFSRRSKKIRLFSDLSAWMCCVSNNVSLTETTVLQAPLLLYIFVCLAHNLTICITVFHRSFTSFLISSCLHISFPFFPSDLFHAAHPPSFICSQEGRGSMQVCSLN